MVLTSKERKLIKIASILGLFQGILWSVMSLGCIILYYMNLRQDDISVSLHILILKESYFQNQILSGMIFHIIIWIYFWCNTVWAVLSLSMFIIDEKRLAKIAKCWVFIAILISLLDVATFISLNFEYHKCMNIVHSKATREMSHFGNHFIHGHLSYDIHRPIKYDNYLEETCSDGILPLISVAARGYIFWVVNIGLIGIVIIKIKNMKPMSQETHSISQIEIVGLPTVATSNIAVPVTTSAPIYEEVTSTNIHLLEQPPNYHDIYPNIYENIKECKANKDIFQ